MDWHPLYVQCSWEAQINRKSKHDKAVSKDE